MNDVIPSMIAIALFVVILTTITATVIQVVDESQASVSQHEVRTLEQVNTMINGPEKQTEVYASSTIELTVQNTGNTHIGNFAQWDLILETQLATTTSITYLTYTTSTVLDTNEWTLLGIYNNASSTPRVAETFSPGILDPGEDMVVLLNPSPAVLADTYDRVTFVTPSGIAAKVIFNVLTPGPLYVVDTADAIVYRYQVDGTLFGTESLDTLNAQAYGITTKGTEGEEFWTTDLADDMAYEYTSSFSLTTSWVQTGPNQDGSGITTDSNNIWISDLNNSVLYKYDMSGGFESTFPLDSANTNSSGVTTDGTNIWIVDNVDSVVYKYTLSGTFVGSFPLTGANANPSGITTNGTNIWVVDVADAAVYKYSMTGSFISTFTLDSANADPQGITTITR